MGNPLRDSAASPTCPASRGSTFLSQPLRTVVPMALPLPSSLSPTKLSSFTDCALAFRFSAVERLPEPPSAHLTRGTLVHAALERLFVLDADQRTRSAAEACLADAVDAISEDPEWVGLELDDQTAEALVADARNLIDNYFALEDPSSVTAVGLELKLEAEVNGVRLRGVIDRLDLVDGELVVTDYKTGKAPTARNERARLLGVHVYSMLVERVFGRRPARVQLLHLRDPVAVIAEPSERSALGLARRVEAVWQAVERACEREDFRPRPSALCDWCSFQRWCPSFGGDPARARIDLDIEARTARGEVPLIAV